MCRNRIALAAVLCSIREQHGNRLAAVRIALYSNEPACSACKIDLVRLNLPLHLNQYIARRHNKGIDAVLLGHGGVIAGEADGKFFVRREICHADGNNVAGLCRGGDAHARRDAVLVERNAMAVRFKRSIHGHIHAGRYTCPLGQDVVFPAAFSQGQRDGVSFHVQERNPDLIEQIALSRRCAEGKRGF